MNLHVLTHSFPTRRSSERELLALLPMAQRERHWPRNLAELQQAGLLGPIIGACAPGETLSAGYSAALLPSLQALLEGDELRQDYTLRSEEHTSELQSLMRISYAVFCLKKKKTTENK